MSEVKLIKTLLNHFLQRGANMYIIPGYVVHHKHDGATILTSKIKQNSVKLTDPAIQKEFDSIIKQAGCPDISTPLTQFLHEQEMPANEQEICQTLQQVKPT